MNAKEIRVALKWMEELGGAAWRFAGTLGKAQIIFEVGKRAVLHLDISDQLRRELEQHTLIDLLFSDGKRSRHARA